MSTNVLQNFERDGYYFPLTVLESQATESFKDHLLEIMNNPYAPKLGNRGQLNFLHVFSPHVNEIIRTPEILNAVEKIIGPNILIWSTSIFRKDAYSKSFVSWHQDLTYWGLSSDQVVSVWLALSEVNQANGCMKFLPESHRLGQLPHEDITDSENLLTRGQRATTEINQSRVVEVELEPGQVSLHHGYLLHSSGANQTDKPRLGVVMTYLSTSVYQTKSPVDYAMLVRGTDAYEHFQNIPIPTALFDDQSMIFHKQMLVNINQVLYDGAKNRESAVV